MWAFQCFFSICFASNVRPRERFDYQPSWIITSISVTWFYRGSRSSLQLMYWQWASVAAHQYRILVIWTELVPHENTFPPHCISYYYKHILASATSFSTEDSETLLSLQSCKSWLDGTLVVEYWKLRGHIVPVVVVVATGINFQYVVQHLCKIDFHPAFRVGCSSFAWSLHIEDDLLRLSTCRLVWAALIHCLFGL